MRKYMSVALIALFMVCLLNASLAKSPAGVVIASEGRVKAVSAAGELRDLPVRSMIYVGDRVITDDGSVVQMLMNDDTVIAQGGLSKTHLIKYAYDDAGSAECDIFIQQGAIRVVTGEIPKINPEKFNVLMPMASVEVHGCSMGFEAKNGKNKIHVLGLGPKEKVVVHRNRGMNNEQGSWQKKDCKRDGVTISIDDGGISTDKTDSDDMENLLAAFKGNNSRDNGNAKGLEQGKGEGHKKHDHGGHEKDQGRGHDRDGHDDIPDIEDENDDGVIDAPDTPETPPPDDPSVGDYDDSPPPPPQDDNGGDDDDTPVIPQSEYTTANTGTHWEWGKWETAGDIDSVEVSSSDIISGAAFVAIADGGMRYNLSGSGDSAAVISHNGGRSLVEGTCGLNVTVGDSVVPTWDVTISAGNVGGDALNFEADGTIHRDGGMEGNQVSYSMNVNGTSFTRGSVTDESITGNIVGTGTGATPVTGGIGEYSFQHGSDASVNGIFASDIN